MQYQLISVPLGLGSGDKGAADGPKALHRCDIKGKLQCTGLPDITVEEVSVRKRRQVTMGDPHVRYLDEIVRVSQEVAERVDDSLQHDRTPIVIGGDHSVNLGAFSGASQALAGQLGLIYIDAHPDMNTADTTPTGNIHGMHLAALMGFGTPELVHVYGNRVKLAKQNLLHVGASDCDLEELDLIKREKLQTFTLFDLLTHNLAPLWKMIDDLAKRVPHIWVSLDLDSIDKAYAPGVGIPNDQGFTYREITTIAEYIGSHCPVAGLDIVEYNPKNDIQHKTAELAITLTATLLGQEYSSYTSYLGHSARD